MTKRSTTKRHCSGCGKVVYGYNETIICRKCRRTPAAMATRFWSKVSVAEGGCWTWTGARFSNGYGHFQTADKSHLAHRLAWELSYGQIPDGLVVCHSCDNPPCCNPAHLSLGTQKENIAECYMKGRGNTGERNGMSASARAVRARLQ